MKVRFSNLYTVWIDKVCRSIFSAGADCIMLHSKYVKDNIKLNATVISEDSEIYQHEVYLRYSSLIRYDCVGADEFELTAVIKN
jgi:hypothetical protein